MFSNKFDQYEVNDDDKRRIVEKKFTNLLYLPKHPMKRKKERKKENV